MSNGWLASRILVGEPTMGSIVVIDIALEVGPGGYSIGILFSFQRKWLGDVDCFLVDAMNMCLYRRGGPRSGFCQASASLAEWLTRCTATASPEHIAPRITKDVKKRNRIVIANTH